MKPIKFSLMAAIALGALMACSTVSNAQDDKGEKKGGEGRKRGLSVEQQMERLTKELALTDEQKPKVKAVLEDTQKKRQELFSGGGGGDRAAMREKMQAISDGQDKQFKEILKADQYEKWEKLRDKMREEMRGRKKAADGEKKDDSQKKD